MNTENNTNNKKIALKIEKLNKTLGKRHILHDIDIEAYEGEVFGFLGPNGAGKTTTIKIIVGLLSLDSGDISIGGYNINKNFEKALAGIGGIVENPEMYKHLTGRENLMQYARMRDGVTKERIDEVVELVGLTKRIDEKIKRYSLGMRQRLGVAQAILHRPKLLILDEPTNGLDPSGIKELRDILKKLAHEENICVMVSSHLMSEMELMCDRVGIIANGSIIGTYTIEEMINSNSNSNTEYVLEVDSTEKALSVIDDKYSPQIIDDTHFSLSIKSDENQKEGIYAVNKTLINSDIKLYTVTHKENKSLEEVFIELTESGGKQID
ncbi:MAG: ABC transporter ATP-binding protein [Ruminococcus sp.]|nr:ABC transporter ATP-binding protein [Ruminococcus sp.]MBQ7008563.1 ABC transporter ATP-binding protein [Ruminococcus sp.]